LVEGGETRRDVEEIFVRQRRSSKSRRPRIVSIGLQSLATSGNQVWFDSGTKVVSTWQTSLVKQAPVSGYNLNRSNWLEKLGKSSWESDG
jgi:hypothetical protein